jgi:hypothetical protein
VIPPAPCRGSVIRVTPSSPKRLYLPLRANLHRQVWGLDSVPAPLTAKPHQLFGAAGGAGGDALQAFRPPPPSGGGSARTMARRQRGADVLISFPLAAKPQDRAEWRLSSSPHRGQGGDFRPRRKYYPVLDGRQARADGRTADFRQRKGKSVRGERSHISARYILADIEESK